MSWYIGKPHFKRTVSFRVFGSFGRDLGNPERWFTDNPNDIFSFIEECSENKAPAFISVQPEKDKAQPLGIEKIFLILTIVERAIYLPSQKPKKESQN
jgi:hypothetical protein